MYHNHSPTGSKTLLHSFDTSSKNGSSIVVPKNLNSSAGVKKIPAILLITVLHSEVATFPPDADVKMMHMLIVVGRHVKIKSPSSNGLERSDGANSSSPFVNGTPTKNGQAPNVMSWMRPFNFKFAAAFVSSESLRLSPERRKIMVTPYFPMKSSGLSILPFFPSSGNSFAKETATPIPMRKKFFDTNALDFATMDGDVASPPPPPLILTTSSPATRNPSLVPK
mmetsp:Transcript_28032/g.56314  ORF Transcript_28032/g.56314 Transcript_28032/m.56314 type:complete len:224 (+) Transcript_28032:627-1298(+)